MHLLRHARRPGQVSDVRGAALALGRVDDAGVCGHDLEVCPADVQDVSFADREGELVRMRVEEEQPGAVVVRGQLGKLRARQRPRCVERADQELEGMYSRITGSPA